MITTSITVNKNYRTSNDDQYARTTLIHNIELEEGETKLDATLRAIKELDEIFTIAYPHVAPHLNFHIVRQTNSDYKPIEYMLPELKQYQSTIHTEKTNNPTIKEQPIDVDALEEEMKAFKKSAALFHALYSQHKNIPGLENTFKTKLEELKNKKTQTAFLDKTINL
jgi:hypothetical protein